ncbi:Anthranilate phosphoribosyltransferase [Gloeomargarita lithophora Alchichica-D10]|uniref:Anthranilate phosphoribosyltransferase n=1 Tax=Gloeomargarita lithophora Alchichica-D10 TaxID=1188229 RepID=A0A1J0ADT4_9CYAN|nr:anthranilate phosphoribosyltransferase family protein [Gloeomargarita lithophora]APB34072.1 Anthranilate phosphoribosyltransferase [Gloeomargarita lithophora Alchichica-D10]
MSQEFREFVRKVGSGTHTHQDLTRSEMHRAMTLMLTQQATPAQVGAFLIAHRIKRPTGAELAGMLDAYAEWGPKLPEIAAAQPVVVLTQPYDGRDRTMPLSPLTALVLASAGFPVLQHGGERMPTKEGLPLVAVWQALGVDWRRYSLTQVHGIMATIGLGFVYLPHHFPQAEALVPYRREIGKRPPIATLELLWVPYQGDYHLMSGFVHPPTEQMMRTALTLRGVAEFTTVKGLEGSCDLPQDRTAIIGCGGRERLLLKPQEYGLGGANIPLADGLTQMTAVLQGECVPLRTALLWNAGFYLWRLGAVENLAQGIHQTATLLDQQRVAQYLQKLVALANGT